MAIDENDRSRSMVLHHSDDSPENCEMGPKLVREARRGTKGVVALEKGNVTDEFNMAWHDMTMTAFHES